MEFDGTYFAGFQEWHPVPKAKGEGFLFITSYELIANLPESILEL